MRDSLLILKGLKMNHDKHYAEKAIEPIDVIEETIDRLTGKLDPKAVFNIGQSLKYILRAGLKEGESVDKDLDKAYNYLHRAKKGTWVKVVSLKKPLTFESLMRKYGLNVTNSENTYNSVDGLSVHRGYDFYVIHNKDSHKVYDNLNDLEKELNNLIN